MIRGVTDPELSRAIEDYVDGEMRKLLNQALWPLSARVKKLEERMKHVDRLVRAADIPTRVG